MLNYLQNRKRIIVSIVAGIVLLTGVWCFGIKTPAYSVYINGQKRFVVKDRADIQAVTNHMLAQKQAQYGSKLEFSTGLEFKRTFVSRNEIIPSKQVGQELSKILQYKSKAAAIVVNGKTIACVDSKKTAEALLKQIKDENSQPEEGEKILSVTFDEKVEIKDTEVALSEVLSQKAAWSLITTGTTNPEHYKIQQGDSLWTIARKNDMFVSEILKANHLKETALLALGQDIILIKNKPFINVIAKLEGKQTEVVPYQTQILTDKKAGRNVIVKTEGKNGQKMVAYNLVMRNGVTQKKDILEEKITQPVVNRVLVKGTGVTRVNGAMQVASRGTGSGNLDWPVSGSITQPFGGGHTGLDIAGSSGASIKAAAAGTVILAGVQGGYGKFVIVDHGNGLVTRYAHCSSLLVKDGAQVSRGTVIATRGSTGHSTGPHLHFEVLQNGAFCNPINFLR